MISYSLTPEWLRLDLSRITKRGIKSRKIKEKTLIRQDFEEKIIVTPIANSLKANVEFGLRDESLTEQFKDYLLNLFINAIKMLLLTDREILFYEIQIKIKQTT